MSVEFSYTMDARTISHRTPFTADQRQSRERQLEISAAAFHDVSAPHATFAFPRRFNARIVSRKPCIRGLFVSSLDPLEHAVCFARIHLRGGEEEGLFCLRGINVAATFTANSPRLRRNSRVLFSDSLSIVRSLLRRGFQRNSQVSRVVVRLRSHLEWV